MGQPHLIIRLERSETSKFVEVEPSIQLDIDEVTFDLRAVITHHGKSTKRGHITTSLYNGKGLWTTCNDERVSFPSKDKPKFGLVYIYDRIENSLNVPLMTQMKNVSPSDLNSPVLKKARYDKEIFVEATDSKKRLSNNHQSNSKGKSNNDSKNHTSLEASSNLKGLIVCKGCGIPI